MTPELTQQLEDVQFQDWLHSLTPDGLTVEDVERLEEEVKREGNNDRK